jgi:hypothetical protein
MSRRLPRASALLALVTTAGLGHAEPTARRTEVNVGLEGRVGQTTAPYVTSAFPRTSGYGGFLVASADLRVARSWHLGLRAPLVLMRVEQPAGALYAEAAWGNPELSASFEYPWHESDGRSLAVVAGLSAGIPVAEHDPAQLAGRALVLAQALEGFSEPGLFTPGVLPLTPAASLRWKSQRWLASAGLRLPLLFRLSEADLPEESDARALGFTPVATVDVAFRVWNWLSLAAAPRLTIRAVAPVDDHAGVVQLLAAGRAELHLHEALTVSLLFQAPVGGPLGGTTAAGGVGLQGHL